MSFFQRFDSREITVCKMGQTGHAEFIRLRGGGGWDRGGDLDVVKHSRII